MDLRNLDAGDLFMLMSNKDININDCDITDDQLVDMELLLMDAVALKRAGNLVCWEASEELH